MINSFKNHIHSKLPFLQTSKLLIAISGGIDSVVLTHLCHKLNLDIALAHCNFNLRGTESDADEAFVLQLAKNLDLEVFIESFDTNAYATANKLSIQMAARALRYNWFTELATLLKFNYVLTAHQADDNLETFLINFTRGTGLEGLTGIPDVNGMFVRPLLPFSRDTVFAFAEANNITWVEDKSNASTKYLRNKLRHEVIPVLKEINPSLLQSFQNTINNLQETSSIVSDSMEALIKTGAITLTTNGYKLDVLAFKKFKNPKAYLYRFLSGYGFTEWDDVTNLLDAQTGKQIFSKNWRLLKDKNHLFLSELVESTNFSVEILETKTPIQTPFGTLIFSEENTILETHPLVIYVDKATIKCPLTLRMWAEGDVFYPLGMHGKKKKVSKFLKDEKVPILEKEQTLVLCSENHIVWVLGKRADNRFKVTDTTKTILKIELKIKEA